MLYPSLWHIMGGLGVWEVSVIVTGVKRGETSHTSVGFCSACYTGQEVWHRSTRLTKSCAPPASTHQHNDLRSGLGLPSPRVALFSIPFIFEQVQLRCIRCTRLHRYRWGFKDSAPLCSYVVFYLILTVEKYN